MADRDDVDGGRGFWGVLEGMNDARGGKKKDHHDEDGNHGPGEFDLGAAVDLGGLVRGVASLGAEFDDDVNEQAEDDDKDEAGDFENEMREMIDDVGGSGARL